jgi:uncharacterized membrane protein
MSQPPPAAFNPVAFHRRRKLIKVTGLVLILVGLFTIIDLMSNIPIPLTGYRAVFIGAVLMMFGFLFLYHGYKLPIEEALNILHARGRGITEAELVHEMRVDRVTAGRIIGALIQKGFVRRANEHGQTEEVFEPVK